MRSTLRYTVASAVNSDASSAAATDDTAETVAVAKIENAEIAKRRREN